MMGLNRKIGFFVFKDIHVPHHLREYYASRELKSQGWEVEWLLPVSGKESPDLVLDWRVARYAECNFRGQKIAFPLYLALFLRRRRIRVVWVSGWAQRDPEALGWLVRILKVFGFKLVYDTVDPIELLSDAQEQDSPRIQQIRARMRQVYRACDLVLTVTPEIQRAMLSLGVPDDKVVACRWGTDATVFKAGADGGAFRREIGVDPDTFLVGWLGSMNPFKGLREIIVPLVEQCARRHSNVHFVIAGYGILEPELRRWVQENPALPVTILGRIPYREAAAFTGSLDAYLVPTNPDSLFARSICPVKCFDAIAMGVPALVTRTEGTTFLEPLSRLVHLCDFRVASFLGELEVLLATPRSERAARPAFNGISHQTVAREITALIDRRLVTNP